jgi:hypothetical protein
VATLLSNAQKSSAQTWPVNFITNQFAIKIQLPEVQSSSEKRDKNWYGLILSGRVEG